MKKIETSFVCDDCGAPLPDEFIKQNGKWLNLCPECYEYRRKKKREATLTKDCTGCRWKDRPQKCSCCRRNQNLKDCYKEAQK